jgi:hypothetical protein
MRRARWKKEKIAGLVIDDSLRSEPYSPPSYYLHTLGVSVFAAAVAYKSGITLLSLRRIDAVELRL